ncbi:MAG: Ig-like domain-containing protein [Gemmatimonadetes bacterium]|nr:Ig-like domain-containing protein [Gemmatimonadota bacterium]
MLLLVGCGGGTANSVTAAPPAPTVATVTVALAPTTIRVGEASSARAIALDANGATMGAGSPVWTIESNEVAQIFENGRLTGIAPGRTTVTASLGGKIGHAELTVLNVAVASMVLTPSVTALGVGSSQAVMAVPRDVRDAPLPGRTVVWSSSDTTRATVTAAGIVVARAAGAAVITATSEGISASAHFTITLPIASIGVTPSSANLTPRQTQALVATLRDSAGRPLADRAVVWSSGAKAVATVSAEGVVTAMTSGTALLTATCEGRTGTATIAVIGTAGSALEVSFAEPSAAVTIGDTLLVAAGVKSNFPIATVMASIERKVMEMKLTPVGALGLSFLWVAKIVIADLQAGPYDVLVTATDDHGGVGVASVSIIHDPSKALGGSGSGGGGFKVIAPTPVPVVP